ncbi:hypothetical protein [Paenibacillus sp. FSL R7-269]|nr:hypothetical protein [Paenibacillus sp. FSL R7-269]
MDVLYGEEVEKTTEGKRNKGFMYWLENYLMVYFEVLGGEVVQ